MSAPIELLPGRVPAQLELYAKFGYPVQLRYMGEPFVYAAAESGELNTFTTSGSMRAPPTARPSARRWRRIRTGRSISAENAKAGNIVEQRNC